jgi:PAS domain S-box-containing protein
MEPKPEPKPKKSRRYTWPYFFLGLLIALILIGIASLIFVIYLQQPVTLQNLVQLHLNYLIVMWIDLICIYGALIWGMVGYQKDAAEDARRSTDKLAQTQQRELLQIQESREGVDKKYQAEIVRLNEQITNQKVKFQDLEAIIQRGKQHWEATFDALDDLIVLTDEKGSILRCNRATGEVFQLGFSQIIGRGIDELFANGSASLVGTTPGEQKEMKLPNTEDWYDVSKSHLLVDGRQEGWVYIFRNITLQKQVLRDQQRLTQYYEILVKNSPVAIVTLNQEDRIIDCNPAFENLFLYSRKEAIGSTVDALITPPELMFEANGMVDAVRKGMKVQSFTQRVRKDGTSLDVEVFGIPVILGGKQVGALGLYHDITNLVHSQAIAPKVDQPVPAVVAELQESTEEPEVEVEQIPSDEPVEAAEPMAATSVRRRSIPIEKIEGIGPVYARKLLEVGVKYTDELLDQGKSRKGREELVDKTGISSLLILKWVNMADLMRIRGIGEEYSELLERAGVDTVKELRNRNPYNLYEAMAQANETYKLVRRLPTLAAVENWVKEAKDSEPLMTY